MGDVFARRDVTTAPDVVQLDILRLRLSFWHRPLQGNVIDVISLPFLVKLDIHVQVLLKEGDKLGIGHVLLVMIDKIARVVFVIQPSHCDLQRLAWVIPTLLHIDLVLHTFLLYHKLFKLVSEVRGHSAHCVLSVVSMAARRRWGLSANDTGRLPADWHWTFPLNVAS